MELAKKSKKQCKKLKKLKPESPAKKLKIDTPCKGVDAKCSIKKKKNLICVNINKLNNKYTKNSSSKNNSIKVFNNFRRKKLDVDKKLNEKKSSALTENVKGQTCNDKMTKVAAPVVKMVEPLLELIDFEEEIKVEKISKDKNSDIIISDYKNFDYEKEIDKNTIKNIENIKGKEKINIVSLEINSNSTDSNLSEYSSKLVISEIPENKYVIPRRNPSRRISQKGERIVKKKIEQQNVEIVNKKRQAKKEVNSTLKNKDLPLTYKDSNQNTNTSVLGKKKIAKHEEKSSNNVSHVPTMVEAIPPSSTSKMNVNTDSKTENLEIEKLENAKIKKNTQNKKREYFKSNIKKVSNKTNIKVDNILEAEKIENKECEEKQNDQISNVKDESLSTLSNQGLAIDSITENVQNNTSEVIVELNFYNKQEEEFRSLENVNESIAINSFNPKNENQENNFQEKNQEISEYISTFNTECLSSNVLEENSSPYIADNLKSNQENIQSQRSSNEFDENITSHTQCELVAEVKEKDKKQETIPNEEPMQKEETDTNIEEDKRCINSIEELPLTETYLNPSTLIKERFFIFDEITEEEILKCQINSNRKHYINVDEKICGEIIHKTREEFSINCYICWDNDNWTFKKFNDLKLFSAHLNSKHSNDQINLQNQRGNSYSLDFVNENSCVMPQSMWFGIYNEMISLKCGFAKINSNGYILYSCLECKSNFKNFTTFTKHILGRENQEKENKNCVIHQDPPPENDSSVSVPLNLFNNCKNDTLNNIEDGSDVILNKITSSNNEKNADTVNNIEDRSEVALNKFTSSNNEKNADTVNNEDGSNITLKKSTTCNNEEKTDTINNIEDGSDITLNSHTSCNNEKNEDTVNNIEDRSEVALNKFTSSNNEKNAGTVNNEDGSNIALKKSTTCNNEKKAETINNIEEGSDALNSLTSCNNENSSDRVNNVEDGSDVLLNSFTSGNNEKNDDKVKNFEDDPNVTLNSLTSCNNEKEKDLANNIKEKNIENEISSPTVKGILESILGKSKVENNMESNENNLLNVQPTNDSLENIEVNQINTEQPIENMKPSCVMEEVDLKSDLEKLARPDTFGYKKITSTLFSILNNDQDESASTKLNKILSLGLNYRDIKEKEKHELEEREKEKLTILSLSVQKDTRLEDPNMLSKNILDLDNKLALLTCKYCNRRYNCVTNLREHFRVHVGDRVLLCLICKRGFSKKSNLEEHIKKFHISTSDLQNIDLDALGDNRKEIARNTNITINENNPKEKGYKCQYCPRFLSNRTALEEHLRIHFGEKPFKCEECNLEFLKKIVYDNHIIEYHTDETEAPRNNLDNFEMNSYDKENNKPFLNKMKLNGKFKCKHCPASYLTRTELIDHLYFHNDGEFKCKFCEQRFDSTKKRCYHEKLHKINSKFKCNFCNKQFPNLYGLEVHENTHKQGALFKCRFCDHYFASENTRSLHEDIHDTVSETNKNLQIQTVDIATILQMNNEQAPMSSNANTNDSNGTSSDGTDRSSNQNTTARNFMVKKIIKKIKRGKRDPNSPLDCRYCKKHFESPHQLSYHERLHEIGKKFQCNICDKIMATSYALELHVTAHLRKKNFSKGFINNKFNGSTFLAHQLRPKIEIVSDITLAPNQTMEILNNFFKREIPSITVTTTSEDESFQKIGVDDIEKNLTAHVLRDTDPYYQLMADFSYQYQMYQNKSISETNESNPIEVPEFVVDREFKATTASKSKKNRKKKVNSETIEDAEDSVFSKSNFLNEENNFEKQNENDFENQTLEITENKTSPESDHSTLYKDSNNKKREKKKISPDVSKNITSVYIKCEYCNKKFNSSDKKSLNHHRRLHIAGDSHKCSFCKKCFATVYYLDKHLRVHHLNDVSEHKCKSCDLVYALKEALRRHELRAHRDIKAKSTQINEKSNEIKDNINHKNCNEKISINTIENNNSNENNEQKFAIPEIPKKSNRRSRSKELKLFHCDFCEKSFPAFNSIQKHINRVHKKDAEDFEANFKFKCTYENCNKKFEFQTNLEKHLRLHESGFKCSICSKKTISQILLDHHMKSHGLPTSHACKYCTSRFTLELSREIHERKVHFKGSIYIHPNLIIKKLNMTRRKVSYRCYNCKESFSSLILLKSHNMYKHPVFECNTCPAIFSKINDIEEHEKIHLKTLQCNICDKTFENKHTLYKHRRQHETKFFKCNMCPAEFSFRDELNEHKKNHDESERPFKCVEMGCDKAFIVETFLNTHLKKIHGYFLFNCDRCKREFLNEELLAEHRKEHEIMSNGKQFRCDQCFKDFSTLTILKIHQKLHQSSVVAAAADSQTPDPQKTSKLKLYTCEQCEKRFSIVTYLNNHLKKVHQVKLFVCEHCKMEFRNEKDLQEHSKVHLTGKKFVRVEKTHLDRPFKCELCGNSYAILAYLNNHLNKAHGNEETEEEKNNRDAQTKSKNNQTVNNTDMSSKNHNGDHIKSDKENSISNGNNQKNTKLQLSQQNLKKNNSVKCDNCYLRFISEKHLKDHSKMHSDPNDSSRIEMLESAFNPQRSEKILNPIINNSRTQNSNNQKEKSKKITSKNKKKTKKPAKTKVKVYEEDSSSSVELIEVSEPPQIPEHNLSYTQITEALSSASTGLTAIQPVELIENPHDEDQQMATTELTPLTTITSLTSLTPLTPLQPTEVFVHTDNDNRISQLQQHHLETSNSIELTPLEPSTISEATKLSLTLLEPSALSELTAFTEPSSITIHSSNLTDLNLSYVDHSSGILNHEHTVLTEFTSSATSTDFETQLITTQCNNNTMLNSSSASSDYAVTNMDTSLITQQVKKPRISDSNIHIETFSSLNDNINQQDLKTQITNFPTFDCTTQFLSTQTSSDLNIAFTDTGLSSKSIMSDSTSLEPLTYSDSMPLSEATTILELTSSSHPTSSSEATAYSESNNFTSTLLNSSGKKKRNSGGKQLNRSYKPNENDLLTLEGDFETCSENNHFKCTLCRRVYDVWIKFRKHNEYHLQRPYQCSICPCNFKTNEELLSHNKAHESTKNNFSCEICNRVFISKSRLKAHMLTVHNDERQFKCDYCPSAFKTKSRLVDHVRCHTGEKPIKCHYCDDHFSRAAYRLKHERAIHPELLEIDTKHKEEKLMEKKNSNKEK